MIAFLAQNSVAEGLGIMAALLAHRMAGPCDRDPAYRPVCNLRCRKSWS